MDDAKSWGPPATSEALLEQLRQLAAGELAPAAPTRLPPGLDAKTGSLCRIAALVALGAGRDAYGAPVGEAKQAGCTDDVVIAAFLAVAPGVGGARIVLAASSLAAALGYDLDDDVEGPDR